MDTLTAIWIFFDVGCLIIVLAGSFMNLLPGFLQDIVTYGKISPAGDKDLHSTRKLLLIPHRLFLHFYALGLVWNVFLLARFLQIIIKEDTSYPGIFGLFTTSPSQQDCFSVLYTLALLTIQLTRRLCESLFVSSFSSKMHLAHFMLAVAFYCFVNLSVVAEIPKSLSQSWYRSCQNPYHSVSWLHCLAFILFSWASYHQYKCHSVLGKLTSWTSDGEKIYKIPYGDWFNHVTAPHYFAEILIYIALFLAMNGQWSRWIFIIIFVVSNLTFSAKNTHDWYKQKFEDYPKNRYIILPYIY
ncbi:polyprenol reductase-like [Dendronephthya gigantea]|uniref:polyprenol reductase-like n=1 Tax=Dendronephthya gigantea TaxID=151771 RepID=UPI00106C875F|nr:polyprenol reductase-like [Dendronephthya gigantea]